MDSETFTGRAVGTLAFASPCPFISKISGLAYVLITVVEFIGGKDFLRLMEKRLNFHLVPDITPELDALPEIS
jgi:hypothetical protein